MKSRSLLAASALALACAACSHTPPTRFYTLVPPAEPAAAHAASRAPYYIDVQVASVPPQVDAQQLVLRRSGGELALVDGQQWSAPLHDEIRSSLAQNLARRLGSSDVHGVGAPKDAMVVKVRIDVTRFESLLGGQARIDADWALSRKGGENVLLRCSSTGSANASAQTFEALVVAHQAALDQLAQAIAGAIGAAGAGGTPGCPS